MNMLISYKLRQFGLELREKAAKGAKKDEIQKRKVEMLGTVYHMLSLFLGTPPEKFYVDYDRQKRKTDKYKRIHAEGFL